MILRNIKKIAIESQPFRVKKLTAATRKEIPVNTAPGIQKSLEFLFKRNVDMILIKINVAIKM